MKLTPRLFVRGADNAIAFYQAAFGATLIERFVDGDGQVVHAAMSIGDSVVGIADERVEWGNQSPETLNGSPVFLTLEVDDADAVAQAMVAGGGQVVIPIEDRFYGKREGRVRDPFGMLWILTQPLESLSDAEIQRRMTEALG